MIPVDHDDAGVPFGDPRIRRPPTRRPRIRVWSQEIARASLAVRWQIDVARATALYTRLRRIEDIADAMHAKPARVSALLEAAGVRKARRRTCAAPRGTR